MDKWNRPAGILLAVIALAVAVNLLAWEFYGDIATSWPVHRIWDVLNWLMAGSIALALAWQWRDKRRQDRAGFGVSGAYLAANLLLFATILLAIWFFRNWLAQLSSAPAAERYSLVWQWVNALFLVTMAATAWQLLSSPKPAAAVDTVPEPVGEG